MRKSFFAACLLVATISHPAAAASSSDGERLLGADGVPRFITGINYEGPADRAWQMWDNDKFDVSAIEADFSRAQQTGVSTIRLFLQASLATDLAAHKFDKIDAVVGLAEKHNVQLIVSLHDYGERDLAKVSATAGQVAQRYRGRPGILGFDLKNEPRFGDLALSKYSTPVPLQQPDLIGTYGERLPKNQLADYRASDEGKQTIPSYLNDDEAWIYVNNLRLYREMLADGAAWVQEHGGTTLDYLSDAASEQWGPLMVAMNTTLSAWIAPQLQAIRAADPLRPVTLDHVDVVLARLPANDALDFESLHRYPGASGASVRANLNLLNTIERAHAGKPFLLTEFGFATANVDPDKAALEETAIILGLASAHAAGGAKWMLNDMPEGYNMRERTLGAFHLDGSPKPVVGAIAELHAYFDSTGSAPGQMKIDSDPDAGARYIYQASDAVMLGGKSVDGGAVYLDAPGPALLFVSWTDPGLVRIWASAAVNATIDLGQIVGANVPAELGLMRANGQAVAIAGRNGSAIDLQLEPGGYLLRVGPPQKRPADYDLVHGHFYTETNGRKESPSGFSVTDDDGIPVWSAFQKLGGIDALGYPVTRRFEMDGFVVQAFQKAVLQWHADRASFAFLNTFDLLHDRGKDGWLQIYRQTPPPLDTAADAGLPFERVVARHLALLDKAPPALKAQFLADPDWLDHYGLPVALQETQDSVVVRSQRASLQYWKEAVPWAAKGSVSVANGGDLAKEAGVFPWLAVTPENAPR